MSDYPNKKELELQERFIGVIERIQAVPRKLWVALAFSAIIALPLWLVLRWGIYELLLSWYKEPVITYVAPNPSPIEILEQQVFVVGEGVYSAFAQIRNPNSDLSVRNLQVRFTLVGKDGAELRSKTVGSYLLPGQDKVLIMPTQVLTEEPINVKTEFEIERWSKGGSFSLPTHFFENQQLGGEPGAEFFASGLYRNESAFTISEVELTALAYAPQGRVIGANSTIISDVLPREARFFRFVWPAGIDSEVARVEFQASINIFKPETLRIDSGLPDENDPRRE